MPFAPRTKPTLKMKKFAKAYVENGGNGAKAAKKAYNVGEKSAKSLAYDNLQKPVVQQAITDLLDKAGLTLDQGAEKLASSINYNLDKGKPSQAVGADLLKFTFKLHNAVPATKKLSISAKLQNNLLQDSDISDLKFLLKESIIQNQSILDSMK